MSHKKRETSVKASIIYSKRGDSKRGYRMAKVFFKQGNAAISVSDELERLVNQILDANPIIKKTMQDEVERIYQDAYREWPVRVDPPKSARSKMMSEMSRLRKEGESPSRAYAIAKSMEEKGKFVPGDASEAKISDKSQDSKNKLQRGVIIDGEDIVAFVRNEAPYAWAIRTGQYTLNDLAYGTRTSNELLWSPMRKAGDRLVDVLADDLINQAKKR